MWRLVGLVAVLIVSPAGGMLSPAPTGSSSTPEFPFAVENLDDGSHLWVGKGSVGRSVGDDLVWATSVPGDDLGPVNDPVLRVHEGLVYVLNSQGVHVLTVEEGTYRERIPFEASNRAPVPDGGFPIEEASGTSTVIFSHGRLEIHSNATNRVVWRTPTYVRAQPLDAGAEDLVLALSGPEWPGDTWWLSAFEADGTQRWNTTVQAYARGFPCLDTGELDGTPGQEGLLAVGGQTALAVDGDGSVLWKTQGSGVRNTQHCRAGEATGDGRTDLVVSTFDPFDRQTASISLFSGSTGELRWTAPTHKGLSYLAFADADGDDVADVVGASYGFSNPGFPYTKPSWPGGARSNHVTAFDGQADGTPEVHWHRTFTPNRGYASSGAADLEVLETPNGVRVGVPLRDEGALLLLDPASGDTRDRLAGVHHATAATWLDGDGIVAGVDGHLWRGSQDGGVAWARVDGTVYDVDEGPGGLAVGYGEGVTTFGADGTRGWTRPLAGPAIHSIWLDDRLFVGEQDADFSTPYQANLWTWTPEGTPIAQRPIPGALWDVSPVGDRTGDGVSELVVSSTGQGRFGGGGNELVDGASLESIRGLPGPAAHQVIPTSEGVLLVGTQEVTMVDPGSGQQAWSTEAWARDALPLDDSTLLVTDWVNGNLQRWSLDTGERLHTWDPPGPDRPGTLQSTGGTVVVGVYGGQTSFWTWEAGEIQGPFHGQAPLACRNGECLGHPGPSLVTSVPGQTSK